MANNRKFDARRAPSGQVKARVNSTCTSIIRTAGGNISKVNMNMVNAVATKKGLPPSDLVTRLRQLGANI